MLQARSRALHLLRVLLQHQQREDQEGKRAAAAEVAYFGEEQWQAFMALYSQQVRYDSRVRGTIHVSEVRFTCPGYDSCVCVSSLATLTE